MFGWFRSDPIRKLENQHDQLRQAALEAQRNGKIVLCAELTSQADDLAAEIDRLKAAKSPPSG